MHSIGDSQDDGFKILYLGGQMTRMIPSKLCVAFRWMDEGPPPNYSLLNTCDPWTELPWA
jgi:hypothetical protein